MKKAAAKPKKARRNNDIADLRLPIADCKAPIFIDANWQSEIGNWQWF
jgi:hypothetical protein